MQWGKPSKVQRSRVSRWGDARLWVGVAVLIGSMFLGARVMASGEETVTLWRATSDLAVGSSPVAVEPVVVSLAGAEESYFQGLVPPADVVIRPVGAGEFIPHGALGAADLTPVRVVTVPVNPLHVAVGVNAGDQVDVWTTVDSSQVSTMSASAQMPNKVLANITVSEIARDVVGTGGDIGVVLLVPETDVPSLVLAMRTGNIDLVKVPLAETIDPVSEVAAS
jgi:hypothetical protein